MDSSLIGKVEKAKRYAQEPERIQFKAFVLRFQGDHRAHELTYREGVWHCTCAYFVKRETCSHSMAMERLLSEMLPARPASLGTQG